MEQAFLHSEGAAHMPTMHELQSLRFENMGHQFHKAIKIAVTKLQHLPCDKAMQGSGLFYFTDLKASSARGVIPIELAKVEASTDKSDKDRFLIKVWVASAYKDIAKHRRYILSSSSSQVQVWDGFILSMPVETLSYAALLPVTASLCSCISNAQALHSPCDPTWLEKKGKVCAARHFKASWHG